MLRDDTAIAALDAIGEDNITWESDYPHESTLFPNSMESPQTHHRSHGRGRCPQIRRDQRPPTIQDRHLIHRAVRTVNSPNLQECANDHD